MDKNYSRELALDMAKVLDDKKGLDIQVLEIAPLTIIADYFVIVTGNSPLHVKALSDELDQKLHEKGLAPRRQEGYTMGRWIVSDYGDVIVHLFHREEREFYHLERLWADAAVLDWKA